MFVPYLLDCSPLEILSWHWEATKQLAHFPLRHLCHPSSPQNRQARSPRRSNCHRPGRHSLTASKESGTRKRLDKLSVSEEMYSRCWKRGELCQTWEAHCAVIVGCRGGNSLSALPGSLGHCLWNHRLLVAKRGLCWAKRLLYASLREHL